MKLIRKFLESCVPRGSAFWNVSILTLSTTVAHGVTLAVMPILSRIYSPEDFGVMAVFVSVSTILVEISGLRYHYAILLPKSERYASALLVLSFFLQGLFVILIFIALLFSREIILTKLLLSVLIPYWYMIPILILGMGAYLTLTQWAIRKKNFKIVGSTTIVRSLSGSLSMVILGLMGLKPLGLLIGAIVIRAGGVLKYYTSLVKGKELPGKDLTVLKRVAIRFRKFPFYDTGAGLLKTLNTQIIPLLLVAFYSPSMAGQFNMAQRVLLIPSVFLGQAIGQVFLQKASASFHEGNLNVLSFKTFNLLLGIGLYPILLISFFAKPIFQIILGPQWVEAGYFAIILGPWIAFAFAFYPLNHLFIILERQGTSLLTEIALFIFSVAAFWLGSKFGGPFVAVGLFGITSLLVSLFKMFFILSVSGNCLSSILKRSLSFFSQTLLLLVLPVGGLFLKLRWEVIVLTLLISTGVYLRKALRILSTQRRANAT